MVLVRLFISFTLGVFALLSCPKASAWDICNETSFMLRVATVVSKSGVVTPSGWQVARPNQCLTYIADSGQPRFVYAESSRAHHGGIREWAGEQIFCASDDDFIADPKISCALQGLQTRSYLNVDPNEQRTALIEPLDYKGKSKTAGIQRLLRDNGYSIASIDGLLGRQTTRGLTAFLKEKGLKSSISEFDKLDALEKAALTRAPGVGVNLCNQTSGPIWAAIAYRVAPSWEARGWWKIEPENCARPFTSSLKNIDAHVFALLEVPDADDLILKSTLAVPENFCIAESRFAATERTNCSARGYSTANFRPLPNDEDGVTLNLTDEDFMPKKLTGLRQ